MLADDQAGDAMSSDVVTFAAKCPGCGADAEWRASRVLVVGRDTPRLVIDCGTCGTTDPTAGLVDVIKRGVSA